MQLRFTIIDSNGGETEIQEPVGWDAITLRMKRDKTWHGFFDFVDDSMDSLQFVGDGFAVLKTEYEDKGAHANVQLRVEFQCADGDAYDLLYLGRFVFSSYKEICGDECISTCGVEALDFLMIFRNRYDQQVNLDSLRPFDGCEGIDIKDVVCDFEAATKEITVYGQIFLVDIVGQFLYVSGTASNDGTYTIVSISIVGSDTVIVVSESLVDETGVTCDLSTGCLVPYDGINKQIILPSQPIRLISEWKLLDDTRYEMDLLLPYAPPPPLPLETPAFSPAIGATASDIDQTSGGSSLANHNPLTESNPPDAWVSFQGTSLKCGGGAQLNINIHASLIDHDGCPMPFPDTVEWKLVIVKAPAFNPIWGLFAASETAGPNRWEYSTTTDSLVVVDTINFASFGDGDILWIYFQFDIVNYLPNTGTYENCFPDLFLLKDDFFRMTYDSVCSDTNTRVYEINEVMSRCVEAYTNDEMRVFSNYFGRTDAQPYPSDVDGCGGLRSIANGLKIRNANSPDGVSQPLMTVSMKDTFDALNATDNIGMGLEDDPNRPDHKLIRVEPIDYFFNDTVLMTCDSIRKVEKDVDASMIFSRYKGGYQKFETWNSNGLYDLFANREYRTQLSELKNELDRTCAWIASNYAIEITRRLYGTTTSDWRYDQDIFFVCFQRKATADTAIFIHNVSSDIIYLVPPYNVDVTQFNAGDSIVITGSSLNDGTYTVVSAALQGGNIAVTVAETVITESTVTIEIVNNTTPFVIVEQGVDNPTNILFPDTVLNYRLAPSRNAMRWLKSILQSYRQFASGKMIFTAGGGNILASGEVLNDDGCRLENQLIQEKQDIDLSLFNDPDNNVPLFYPELVKFEYPMSYAQYLTVKNNPYGIIEYQCGSGDMQQGWIEDMQYSPYEGMVNFVLRPKIQI